MEQILTNELTVEQSGEEDSSSLAIRIRSREVILSFHETEALARYLRDEGYMSLSWDE